MGVDPKGIRSARPPNECEFNMIFSESWLREFVDPGMATAELVETLTMAGLEVDGVTSAASQFSGLDFEGLVAAV